MEILRSLITRQFERQIELIMHDLCIVQYSFIIFVSHSTFQCIFWKRKSFGFSSFMCAFFMHFLKWTILIYCMNMFVLIKNAYAKIELNEKNAATQNGVSFNFIETSICVMLKRKQHNNQAVINLCIRLVRESNLHWIFQLFPLPLYQYLSFTANPECWFCCKR